MEKWRWQGEVWEAYAGWSHSDASSRNVLFVGRDDAPLMARRKRCLEVPRLTRTAGKASARVLGRAGVLWQFPGMIFREVPRTARKLSLRASCDALGVADGGNRRTHFRGRGGPARDGLLIPCQGMGRLLRNSVGVVVLFLLSLHLSQQVLADLPRVTLRISITANGEYRMNGVAASDSEVTDALNRLSPKRDVVQLYGENHVPSPYGSRPALLRILHRSLPVQFALKSDFSDITENTPAMRIHPWGTDGLAPRTTFTDCVAEVCPVHQQRMTIMRVGMSRPDVSRFGPTIQQENRDARYPFRGAAIDGVFFSGKAEVSVCPSCSGDYAALIKKYRETPLPVGKWTVYVSLRAVPKELWQAAARSSFRGTAVADAGEPFAFGCMARQGEPRQRFVLAGTHRDVGFVVWEQGGVVCQTKGAVFRRSEAVWNISYAPTSSSGTRWEPSFDIRNRKAPDTVETLVEAVEARIRETP